MSAGQQADHRPREAAGQVVVHRPESVDPAGHTLAAGLLVDQWQLAAVKVAAHRQRPVGLVVGRTQTEPGPLVDCNLQLKTITHHMSTSS